MGVVSAFQPETKDDERVWKIKYPKDNDMEDMTDAQLATGAALLKLHESTGGPVATIEEGTRIATLVGKRKPVRPLSNYWYFCIININKLM